MRREPIDLPINSRLPSPRPPLYICMAFFLVAYSSASRSPRRRASFVIRIGLSISGISYRR